MMKQKEEQETGKEIVKASTEIGVQSSSCVALYLILNLNIQLLLFLLSEYHNLGRRVPS